MKIDALKKFLVGQKELALKEIEINTQRIAQLIYSKNELEFQLLDLEKKNIRLDAIAQSCIDINKKIDEKEK